jgi:long-chain acyl-CoA synthetase
VFGDRRRYITALLSLNEDEIKRFAGLKKLQYKDYKELVKMAEVRDMISSVISEKNKGLSPFEAIKKFAILDRDFTIEDGELTPTLKVKRRLIEERYRDVIEGLYD